MYTKTLVYLNKLFLNISRCILFLQLYIQYIHICLNCHVTKIKKKELMCFITYKYDFSKNTDFPMNSYSYLLSLLIFPQERLF